MIAARRDYVPYAELRTDIGTDMYRGGLPMKGNYRQFSIDESDKSVMEAVVGEENEKKRVEYATRESGGIEFSGYTAVTNFEYLPEDRYYDWGTRDNSVQFTWEGGEEGSAKMHAETFDIGLPSTMFQAVGPASESVALPGEEVSYEIRVIASSRTGPQMVTQSRTQTENAGVSHEVDVSISSLQSQVVRTMQAEGEVDDKALGDIEIASGVESPYFNVNIGYLDIGTELDESILGAKITPVTLEWIKETGTISSPSARFMAGSSSIYVGKKVPNWYYQEIGKWRPQVSGVVCQCAARVVDSTLGVIMYCPNKATDEENRALVSRILDPADVFYGTDPKDISKTVPAFNYPGGKEPTSVDGARLLGRRNVLDHWSAGNPAMWRNGGDWQTLYEVIDVQGGTGTNRIAYPRSMSKFEGKEGHWIRFYSDTAMSYCFPYGNETGGVSEFKVGPVAQYLSLYVFGRISAYTIAQAGNTTGKSDNIQLLRQAKEVFPSRILRISAHTETDSECRTMNGFSTNNLNAEISKVDSNKKSVSAIPRTLLTTTHNCSSRLMASFSADTNVSSTLSLPSAVSASVIHDDGGKIYALFHLLGLGENEDQHWPEKDFGYFRYVAMQYTDQNEKEHPFAGWMDTLVYYDYNLDQHVELYQLPTYIVRGAKKGSSRSTLFSQTAYLLEEVIVGEG